MINKISAFLFLNIFILLLPHTYAQNNSYYFDKDSLYPLSTVHGLFKSGIDNPAYTGVFGGQQLYSNTDVRNPFFNHRLFYMPLKVSGAYDITFGKEASHAAGIYYSDSRGGIYKGWAAGLNYAYGISLFKSGSYPHKLRLGASFSYNKATFERMSYTFGDNIDPKYGHVWNSAEILYYQKLIDTLKTEMNLNAGFWYHNPHFYLGLATNSFSERDTLLRTFNAQPASLFLSAGGHIHIANDFALHPAINMDILFNYMYPATYSPALTASYRNMVFLGFAYKDFNKATLHIGGTFFKTLTVSAMYGVSTYKGADIGVPSYLAGNIRLNFNKK